MEFCQSKREKCTHQHIHMNKHWKDVSVVPETAPIVFSTFGKLNSVRTPSPPTAGPHDQGPALKSINAHLMQFIWILCISVSIIYLGAG